MRYSSNVPIAANRLSGNMNFMPLNRSSQHIDRPCYICKIYLCGKKSVSGTSYCEDHTSPLRTGKPLFSEGAAPISQKWKDFKYGKSNNR
jgi:hypothetical protein